MYAAPTQTAEQRAAGIGIYREGRWRGTESDAIADAALRIGSSSAAFDENKDVVECDQPDSAGYIRNPVMFDTAV